MSCEGTMWLSLTRLFILPDIELSHAFWWTQFWLRRVERNKTLTNYMIICSFII